MNFKCKYPFTFYIFHLHVPTFSLLDRQAVLFGLSTHVIHNALPLRITKFSVADG